jgi:hypothetical protein
VTSGEEDQTIEKLVTFVLLSFNVTWMTQQMHQLIVDNQNLAEKNHELDIC